MDARYAVNRINAFASQHSSQTVHDTAMDLGLRASDAYSPFPAAGNRTQMWRKTDGTFELFVKGAPAPALDIPQVSSRLEALVRALQFRFDRDEFLEAKHWIDAINSLPERRALAKTFFAKLNFDKAGLMVATDGGPATDKVVIRMRQNETFQLMEGHRPYFLTNDKLKERYPRSGGHLSSLIRQIRRMRDFEGVEGEPSESDKNLYVQITAKAKRRTKRIAEDPDILHDATDLFSSGMPELEEMVNHSEQRPTVDLSSIWLAPNGTPALVQPPAKPSTSTQPVSRMFITAARVAASFCQVRKLEGQATLVPEFLWRELRGLVEETNQELQSGNWKREDFMLGVGNKLDKGILLWSKNKDLTHLQARKGGLLELAAGKPSEGTDTAEIKEAERTPSPPLGTTEDEDYERRATKSRSNDEVPISIPFTTAASEFIYGSNTVLAALRARRRKLYHLYLHPRLSARAENASAITALAKSLGIPTTPNADIRLLDKLSDARPHNGVVLETSRLPAPPLLSLAKPNTATSIIPLTLDRQSAEDIAVNGAPVALHTPKSTWRHPLVLLLDGILDPGNIGTILRTAHFYGVDAVAVATNTCAPLTSAALAKASSGACEALPIFALPKPSDFVYQSARAGWKVYAAVAPPTQPKELR